MQIESELNWLDTQINKDKSVYIGTGPQFNCECYNIVCRSGLELKRVSEVKCLGVFIVSWLILNVTSVMLNVSSSGA